MTCFSDSHNNLFEANEREGSTLIVFILRERLISSPWGRGYLSTCVSFITLRNAAVNTLQTVRILSINVTIFLNEGRLLGEINVQPKAQKPEKYVLLFWRWMCIYENHELREKE